MAKKNEGKRNISQEIHMKELAGLICNHGRIETEAFSKLIADHRIYLQTPIHFIEKAI